MKLEPQFAKRVFYRLDMVEDSEDLEDLVVMEGDLEDSEADLVVGIVPYPTRT
jgi:plasmid maintenance system killer protein